MYKIICHWSRLDWHFPNAVMQEEFETNQSYKRRCPPARSRSSRTILCLSSTFGSWYSCYDESHRGQGRKPLLDAFPSWDFNKVGDVNALQSVLGYEIDEYNRMWLLDQGKIAYESSPEGSQKLVIWDLNRNSLIDSIVIPDEIAPYRTSFLNDLVVDNKNGFVYITDSGCGYPDHPLRGGVIVYNMKTKSFRRVLDRQFSTQDFPDFHFQIDYKPVFKNQPLRIGADGIALSADRSTLYYCQVTGRNLYAIHTGLLRNEQISLEQINGAVQVLGSKGTTTDGMHADNRGNLFYTMLEGKGIDSSMQGTAASTNSFRMTGCCG